MPNRQLLVRIGREDYDRLMKAIERLNYADVQHWLLDMARITINGKIKATDERIKNKNEDLVLISVRMTAEYHKKLSIAIINANFRKQTDWLLACIEETVKKI